jgi:DNA topoisomerase-1
MELETEMGFSPKVSEWVYGMARNLVIVESPAKAKTIGKYLGSDYTVEASIGHIMDLPKNDIGVELLHRTFEPTLIISPGKEKVVDRLKKLAAKADAVFLAPDPDREGEAIAAHLKFQLLPAVKKGTLVRRVTFNEITKKAVQAAFDHTRDVDEDLVDAQQTRRVLDRLVGYQISPLLWDKVKRGLSAGRVQTVALRLIVEREREINAFPTTEYWNIDAVLTPKGDGTEFTARMTGINGQSLRVADRAADGKFLANALPDKAAVDEVLPQLEKAVWSVKSVEKKERQRRAQAPYTTSKLQQDAAGRLGFGVRRTMGVAQRLYEGIDMGPEGTVGLITYMRTDSTRMSPDAIESVRAHVKKQCGTEYVPEKPNVYSSKKDAQDAHEAVRPTNIGWTPDFVRKYVSDEQFRLYQLIWERAVTSQMVPAVFDQTTVEIEAKADMSFDFRTTGSVLKFAGFLWYEEQGKKAKAARDAAAAELAALQDKKAAEARADGEDGESDKDSTSEESSADRRLPALENGQALNKVSVDAQQKFTQPPPRFNEASLVKTLEENGIGRPSTYASIINTIQERDYVKKIKARLVPTEIGMVVTDLLVKNFPYIFETGYTAQLEGELDAVEAGTEKWTDLLKGFYSHLEKELKVAAVEMEDIKAKEEATDEVCEKCGAPLLLKWGKFGSFYSCSNFTKEKPMVVSAAALKKDTRALLQKVEDKFGPMELMVRGTDDKGDARAVEVKDRKKLEAALKTATKEWKRVTVDPESCDFTKENIAAKPDLNAPGADANEQEDEACDNCGRTMIMRNGPWGPFMACPGYNEDPPCKTIRKLTQKVQSKPPVQLEEPCPKCGKPLLQRDGQYGEFIACSGYPKCKYVKQELLDVPCPKCGGEVAVRKNRRGDLFYGCTRYPKCDFTSNQKLVNETCPKCDSAYLVEVSNAEGTYLVCPNNREMMPKKRVKKGAPEEVSTAPECSFDKKIGPPKPKETPKDLEKPDPEKTRPLAEAMA